MTMATRPRRARVARQLIQDVSPVKRQSSSKRTSTTAELDASASRAKKPRMSEDEDSSSSLSTNSFYGKKTSRYFTPLERKARRESQETDSENVSQSSVDEDDIENFARFPKVRVKRKDTGRSDAAADIKRGPWVSKANGMKSSQSPLSEIKSGSPRSPAKNMVKVNGQNSGSPESIASSDASGEKRFFKSRTPLVTKSRNSSGSLSNKKKPSSASKMTQKGLKMLYKPASMKNRTTPSSPDIKLKKRSSDSVNNSVRRSPRKHPRMPVNNHLDSDSSDLETLGEPLNDDIPPIPRRSPRKKPHLVINSPLSSMGSDELFSSVSHSQTSQKPLAGGDQGDQAKSPNSQSSCTDSVLLLSELETESNNSKSPDKGINKLHPFFIQGTPKQSGKSVSETSSRSSTPQNVKTKTPTPRTSPNIRTTKIKDSKDQYIIDAGQKLMGATQCAGCGLTYFPQDGSDNATHRKFHTKVLSTLTFRGWKNERIAKDFLDGSRIIIVMADEKQAMKKVNAVKEIVDEDLGFVVESPISRYSQIYMFISDDKKIVGFCIAEKISSAYRMIANNESTSPVSPSDNSQPWCCSTDPEPAKCGINRIWVLRSKRRTGIAKKLLESVRGNFMMGKVLSKGDLAFTDPTPDGRNFAASYIGSPSFLVYKHHGKKSSP